MFHNLNIYELENWLRQESPDELLPLWHNANLIRDQYVGNEVHFRGLIEISNYCNRQCLYCGIRGERKDIHRYRMSDEEILECVDKAKNYDYGTIVIQGGEDPGISPKRISELVKRIKSETDMAVTLSLGEQPEMVFRLWRKSGADRYLLKIETTDTNLLKSIHPGEPYGSRMECLYHLQDLGYEIGSGVMIGIPGQTHSVLSQDLEWFRKINLDMIGIGPYLPHPDTPLGQACGINIEDQVPNTELMTNKTIALARILCPEVNIPATTALTVLNPKKGRERVLSHGANVVMPNLTPLEYRILYDIYPKNFNNQVMDKNSPEYLGEMVNRLGRPMGKGQGGREKRRMKYCG